jgi:hypothetical protein
LVDKDAFEKVAIHVIHVKLMPYILQRFFRHMCMSAKVPAVVKLAKEALAENKCVVIGLQSTGEARTEEAVTKYVR